MRRIEYLIVHHNGHPDRTIDDIRRTHVDGNGWRDVGYHYVYHEDGSEHAGRPEAQAGAHVAKLNHNTLGYCVIGNGNVHDFNPAQYRALVGRLAETCVRFGLDPLAAVRGHRETGALIPGTAFDTRKTCPGTKVDMDRLRARVSAAVRALEQVRPPRSAVCPTCERPLP